MVITQAPSPSPLANHLSLFCPNKPFIYIYIYEYLYNWIYLSRNIWICECIKIFVKKKLKNSTNEFLNIFVAVKSNKYIDEWIYFSINTQIYSNIRIFATHCPNCLMKKIRKKLQTIELMQLQFNISFVLLAVSS